jgi:FSR family fosmidomycin resistance protein-like MFS transporter
VRWLKSISGVVSALLLIELLDELVFGAREAAWPLVRNDLQLTYLQVGVILGVPGIVSSIVEPFIGILGDVWKRRTLILTGGVVFGLALMLIALSQNFFWLLCATILFYPASGAFVSLSQAVLMDTDPERHEKNMARWTFAGSLGVVLGPLVLSTIALLGWSWRFPFGFFAIVTGGVILFSWRSHAFEITDRSDRSLTWGVFWDGLRAARVALFKREVLRWLILLQFSDLMLDILFAFLALYFVDVAGVQPFQAGIAVAIWTGTGLVGDFLLIPLLERVPGLKYLRFSALLMLVLFPSFLLIQNWTVKLLLVGAMGLLNSGWYAIPQGQLYTAMPGQSGTVMTLTNIFGLLGSLMPMGIGIFAQYYGLQNAIWFVILGPVALLIGLPRFISQPGELHSTIRGKEK